MRRWRKSARGKFCTHKDNAARRGVPFLLTFDQWWEIWRASDKWEKRGNRRGKYCMCRRNDLGAYAIGNVYIGLYQANTAERNRTWMRRSHTARSDATHFDDYSDVPF
jgi:hypothetical protein